MMGGPVRIPQEAGRSWDPADLTSRLANALAIAERAVRTLAATGYQDAADPAAGVAGEKIVSETAFLLLACDPLRAHCANVRQRIENVARLLIPYARNERVVAGLCMEPGLAFDYAFAHICLSRLGFPDPRVEHVLRLSLGAEVGEGHERLPHRMLEREWLKRVRGQDGDAARGAAGWAGRSTLGRPIDVFAATRDDIYAWTHALMYFTDLGERKVRLPRSRTEVLASAEVAVARCLDQEDYDLCGEVLLTWPYLAETWSATAAFAFHVLARVEDEAGFLPAPLTRLDRYYALNTEERSRYAMATAYHTAYVMGLLCAAALRPGKAPPARIPVTRHEHGIELLLEFIDSDGRRPHWRADLSNLQPREREALAPMLQTIALRRAVERGNLEFVRTVLEHVLRSGLVNLPSPRQAAALLRRLGAAEISATSKTL